MSNWNGHLWIDVVAYDTNYQPHIYNAVLKSLPKLRSHLIRGDLSISHHGKVGQQVTTTWCQACLQSDSSSKLNSFDSLSAFRTADVFQMRNIFKNLKLKYLRLFLLDITILILKIKKIRRASHFATHLPPTIASQAASDIIKVICVVTDARSTLCWDLRTWKEQEVPEQRPWWEI